jgi:hypothetical protein
MSNIPWWGYVILAGLAWGTYVPIIFYGGQQLTPLNAQGAPVGIGGRLASILMVGAAYFVLGVLVPVVLMATRDDTQANWKMTGLVFSALAGVAGAVGAICVIFASKAAVDQGRKDFQARETVLVADIKKAEEENKPEAKAAVEEELMAFRAERPKHFAAYRILIAPLIFSLAPLINVLLSLVWHPRPDNAFHFGFDMPSWHLPVGILLVALGTFLVLYSKEAGEANKSVAPKPTAPAAGPPPAPIKPA